MKKLHILLIVALLLILLGLLGKLFGQNAQSDCITYYNKDGSQVLWEDCD